MGRPIKYSKEFKVSAVKLVTELGYSCREAGEQLGCSSWSVRDGEFFALLAFLLLGEDSNRRLAENVA